ncbi:NAD-dependent epimerase/dehydratase family protein [Sphingopyxis sp. J-6]|uniref:NAD-dependent epimerase/dehydratase family protein n=1 Tax=Sphingopyxis sp. J-6 TaxID=3122054 RepID=UPI0039843469
MPDALIVGATGMVGRSVAEQATAQPLTILARRDTGDFPPQHRLQRAAPDRWPGIIAAERPAILISCLGTTIRQAGSEAAFRAVDHDLVLAVAAAAKEAGTSHMIAVSSVGAAAKSRNFYLRTKGEVEEALRGLGFGRLDILRPGLLTGDRQGPPRLGEGIAMLAAPLTDALMHGSLRRYRSIPGATVAAAIVRLAGAGGSGSYVHENDAIRALAD